MSDASSVEQTGSSHEQSERLNTVAFSLRFDKAGLEAERGNIDPAGHRTLDAFLNFPEQLDFPKGVTLIVGSNGIGKSTLLGVISMLGEAASLQETDGMMVDLKKGISPMTFEEARADVIEGRGKGKVEKKKLGIAPNIAGHTTVISNDNGINRTRKYNTPEITGRLWALYEDDDMGQWGMGNQGQAEFRRGGDLIRRAGVVGSTQQIIDQQMFKNMKADLEMFPGKSQVVLLDEPTGSADLQRTLNIFHDLDQINRETTGGKCTFVVATNEGLLALNRNTPRIDLEHPERGVHFLRDYPLEPNIQTSLQEMGYAPIPNQAK